MNDFMLRLALALPLVTACHSTKAPVTPVNTSASDCESAADPVACEEALSEPEGPEDGVDSASCEDAADPVACEEALSEPEGEESP